MPMLLPEPSRVLPILRIGRLSVFQAVPMDIESGEEILPGRERDRDGSRDLVRTRGGSFRSSILRPQVTPARGRSQSLPEHCARASIGYRTLRYETLAMHYFLPWRIAWSEQRQTSARSQA